MAELRFGLIGLGIHGARYADHLSRDLPGVRLSAVCRQDAGALEVAAKRHGADPHADYREMLRHGGLDAVCAVVPPDLHPDIAEAASEAGVALLLEKPLAVDLDGAGRILRAASGGSAPILVAHTLRYNRVVLRLRELLPRLGPIHLVALNQRFEPTGRDWLDRPGPGGVVLNTAIHEFDLIRFLTGLEPRSVRCRTRRVATEHTEDLLAAVIDLEPGGVLATVDASRAVGGRSGRIEIAGREGQLCGDHSLGSLIHLRGREHESLTVGEPVPTVLETLRDFVRLVRREIPNPIPPIEGARAVALAVACLRSARQGGVPAPVEAVEIPA